MKLRAELVRKGCVIEIEPWQADAELERRVDACIDAQRGVLAAAGGARFEAGGQAEAAVSPAALEALLSAGRDVHGIAREREISNVVTFNAEHIEGAVHDGRIARLRRELDAAVGARARELFPDDRVSVLDSGHFWYPPGGYMGWHTNSRVPGWRLYVTRTDEPGQSFFRYLDPDDEEIRTSLDSQWNFRLFRIRSDEPFWHAVYSDTNRFSFGFMIVPRSIRQEVRQRFRRLRSFLPRRSGR